MDREVLLTKAAETHSPEYIQALKDFLDKKITYEDMMKICSNEKQQEGAK
jgi:hypothetical protein